MGFPFPARLGPVDREGEVKDEAVLPVGLGDASQWRNLQIARWVHHNGVSCDYLTERCFDLVIHFFRDQLNGSGGCIALVWTLIHCSTDCLVSPVLSAVDRDALDPLVEGMHKRVIANWAGWPHQASWLTLGSSCGSSLTFKVSPWWWASSSGRSNVGQRKRLGLGGRSTGKEVRDCCHGWCLGSFGTGSRIGKEVRDCCHGWCHCLL